MPDITHDDDAVKRILSGKPRIAVVGASDNPARDSNRIFGYLQRHGYEVLPVNPVVKEVLGVAAVANLEAAAQHWQTQGGIDMVDVFRNADAAPGVVQEAIAAGAKSIWFQLGVVNQEAIDAALGAGLEVVVDRCIKIEHARLMR